MFIQVLRWFADKMSMKPVSVDAAGSRTCSKKKAGFTIVELMVVIIIVNLLSGVAVPKITDLIEKTKQKIDLLQLYYLRDALNRALYESEMTNDGSVTDNKGGCQDVSISNMNSYLKSTKGMLLFVVEQNGSWPANYQGSGKEAGTNNMCGLLVAGGFWNTAFHDAGFGAIADIVYARAKSSGSGNEIPNFQKSSFTAYQLSNGWWRTYPTKPLFISRFMNNDHSTGTNQTRFAMKMQWHGMDPKSQNLEVFFGGHDKDWDQALLSRQGVCFSTYGQAGCKRSTPK